MSNLEDLECIGVEKISESIPTPSAEVAQIPVNTKVEIGNMKGAFWFTALYFKLGYWTASSPIKWNESRQRAERVTSNWHALLRTLNLLVVITSSILQILGIGLDIYHGTLELSNIVTIVHIGAIFMTGYTVVFQIHAALKASDVMEFSNHVMDYFRFVDADGCFKNPKKLDRFVGGVMGVIGISCYFPMMFTLSAYLFRCDFHILSKLLPTCDYNDGLSVNRQHRSGPWILFYAFVLFYCTNQNVTAALRYITIIVISTVGCRLVLDSMVKDVANVKGTAGRFRDPERWFLHYRCLRMLFNRMNITFGKFILPFFLTIILVVAVTVNYVILLLDFTMVMAYGAFLGSSFMACTCIALYQGALFAEMTKDVIETQKANCRSEKTWFSKVLRHCLPLAVDVGGYFKIGKMTVLEYLSAAVNYTIEVVLSFPAKDFEES